MKRISLNSLAVGNLKHRKKQYILLIIGIILSMIFSSCVLFFIYSAVTSLETTINQTYGSESMIVVGFENEAVKETLENAYNECGYIHTIGRIANPDESQEKYTSIGWADKTSEEMYLHLKEGKLPEKTGEIAMEKETLLKLKIDAKIGDTIKLNVYTQNGKEVKDEYFERNYILVGILKDKWENISEAGYGYVSFLPTAFVFTDEKTAVGGKELISAFAKSGGLFDSEANNTSQTAYYDWFIPYVQDHIKEYNGLGNTVNVSAHIKSEYIQKYTGSQSPYFSLVFFSVLFMLMSNLGIINAFNTNLKERKRQIGLLRAMGATKRQIRKIYSKEAIILSLICAPVSCIVSVILVKIIVPFLGDTFVFKPVWWALIACLIVSVIIVILSSLIPLFTASRLSPMQSIRNIEISRKMKIKKIKTKKEFDVSTLIAKRNVTLYKSKNILTSLIICISVIASGISFSAYKGEVSQQTNNYGDDYYASRSTSSGMVNYGYMTSGYSENQLQELMNSPYIESVDGNKRTGAYLKFSNLSDYQRLIFYMNESFITQYQDLNITKENYRKESEKVPEQIQRIKDNAKLEGNILRVVLYGASDRALDSLNDSEVIGKIDKEKLDSGEEVILTVPKEVYLLHIEGDPENDSPEMLTIYTKTFEGENLNPWESAQCDFKAGDEIDLGWLYSDKYSDTNPTGDGAEVSKDVFTKQENKVKIGAIVYDSSIFNDNEVKVITSVDGINNFADNVPYHELKAKLKRDIECNDEIDNEIKLLISSMNSDGRGSYFSKYEREQNDVLKFKTFLMILLSILILCFSVVGSMINNSITARIRESKREIGTLRAVGASVKDISSSYFKQLLYILGGGSIAGFIGVVITFGGIRLWWFILGQPFDDFIFTITETLIAVAVLLIICTFNMYLKVKKEMKSSVVDNIREL